MIHFMFSLNLAAVQKQIEPGLFFQLSCSQTAKKRLQFA